MFSSRHLLCPFIVYVAFVRCEVELSEINKIVDVLEVI